LQDDGASVLSASTPSAFADLPMPSSPVLENTFFPSSIPPKMKSLSAKFVASRIMAIAPAYVQYHQKILEHGFDGETVSTFAGQSYRDVSQQLEILGISTKLERDRIASELGKLFDPRTLTHSAASEESSTPLVSTTLHPFGNSAARFFSIAYMYCCAGSSNSLEK
jgi:hypothetical protein